MKTSSIHPPKPAPTVLIVPCDLDVLGTDLSPPFLKLRTRNVEGSRRNEVIKNNIVLLAPTEGAEVI